MDEQRPQQGPFLAPIKDGWAARGVGWAAHAPTQEEAIRKFRERERRYREIDAEPFWHERIAADAARKPQHE